MAERVRVREIDDDEGRRLLRIIRRGTGSVVTWRRAQMVLLSAQAMPVAKIAEVTFTSADRVRNVIHNFNADGFDSLYPKYKGGRPKTFTLPERREIEKMAKSKPAEHGLPFSTWSLAKLADFLVAEGVVDDISHEGLRVLLREEGVSFQRVKTWKTSRDPDYAAKKARVEHLYAIADGEVIAEEGEPEVIFCMDEFGPLNLQPHPGRQWAERGGRHKDPDRDPRARRRATYTRPHGVRHLFAAYDLAKDQLYGHVKKTKNRSKFLEFCRYLRSLHPAHVRIAIVCDNCEHRVRGPLGPFGDLVDGPGSRDCCTGTDEKDGGQRVPAAPPRTRAGYQVQEQPQGSGSSDVQGTQLHQHGGDGRKCSGRHGPPHDRRASTPQ
ncbi:IS630 family transposase [Streptomyces flaveolus]|uniref:IS630 family transposase n=1 Tax=Streptomyces flaveolus TaxID=67297 RepID=UPI003F4D7265